MTVKQLKELLANVPDDAVVIRRSDEYNGAITTVKNVEHRRHAGWGVPANTVIIS